MSTISMKQDTLPRTKGRRLRRVLAPRLLAGVAVLVAVTAWAADHGAKKAEDVTITGTLSCAACTLVGSPEHICSKKCCQGCVQGGDSALLEDAEGNLFLLISRDKEKPVITPERMDLMSERVAVKGILVKKGGLQGIYVESLEKAPEKAPPEK